MYIPITYRYILTYSLYCHIHCNQLICHWLLVLTPPEKLGYRSKQDFRTRAVEELEPIGVSCFKLLDLSRSSVL